MSSVRLDAARLVADGDALYGIANALSQAVRACESALGSTGGMAGDDESAEVFAQGQDGEPGYDRYAVDVLKGAFGVANSLKVVDAALGNSGRAYDGAQLVGAFRSASSSRIPEATATVSEPHASVPTALGKGPEGPLGEFGDFLKDALATLGVVLPSADTGKLGAAESAWSELSSSVSRVRGQVDSAFGNVQAMSMPQQQSMLSCQRSLSTALGKVSESASSMSGFARGMIDSVNQAWEEIGWFIAQMAVEIAIEIGLGALLGMVTFGAGAAAMAAKIALTVTRWALKIAALCKKLRMLVMAALRAARLAIRGGAMVIRETLSAGLASAITTVSFNTVRGALDPNFQPQNVLNAALSAAAGGAAGGGVSRIGAGRLTDNVANSGLRRATHLGVETSGGAIDGLVSGAVESGLNGTAFSPLSSIAAGALLGGALSGRPGGAAGAPSAPTGSGPGAGVTTPDAGSIPSGGTGTGSATQTGGGTTVDLSGDAPTPGSGDSGSNASGDGGSVDIPTDAPTPGSGDGGASSGGDGSGLPDLPTADASGGTSGDAASGSDAPTIAAPSVDAPSGDGSTPGAPSVDAPSSDGSTPGAPSTESTPTDAPSADAPSADAPSADAPTLDAPQVDVLGATPDAPASDAPTTPAADTPAAAEAGTPTSDAPSAPPADVSPSDAPDAPSTTSEPAAAATGATAEGTAASPADAAAADGTTPDGADSGGTEADVATADEASVAAFAPEDAAVVGGAAVAAGGAALLTKPSLFTPKPATPVAPPSAQGPSAPTADASASDGSAPTGSSDGVAPEIHSEPGAHAPDAPTAPGPDAVDGSQSEPDGDGAAADTTDGNHSDRTLEEIDQALSAINPNFDPYDLSNGYANNCGHTSANLNDFLNGHPVAEAPGGTTLSLAEMQARTGTPQVPLTTDQIADTLRALGPGAHCVVGIDRTHGPGHWFNAYFDGTDVWSLDAQNHTRSPWPPFEPTARLWDASIPAQHVVPAATPDSSTPDAGTPDAGTPNSTTADSATPDSATPHTPSTDGTSNAADAPAEKTGPAESAEYSAGDASRGAQPGTGETADPTHPSVGDAAEAGVVDVTVGDPSLTWGGDAGYVDIVGVLDTPVPQPPIGAMDPATVEFDIPADAHVFWSGRTELTVNGATGQYGSAGIAAGLAGPRDATTLEMYLRDHQIAMPAWDGTPEVAEIWGEVSKKYAEAAHGDVRVVLGRDLRPGNVWETYEFDALTANPAVTRIIAIDPGSGAMRLLFERQA